MTGAEDLLPQELEAQGWRRNGRALSKTFRFADVAEATAWMAKVGEAVRKMNHHPEWTNRGAEVAVRLTTHDAGDVTEKDVALAWAMEAVAGGRRVAEPRGAGDDRVVPSAWRGPRSLIRRDRGEH